MSVFKNCISVADYISGNESDLSDIIQELIDSNPNRTIFFPDGVYHISKPIVTPADPQKSVDLRLSSYAVIRATPDWSSDEAMIRLGASHPANDIRTCGSNYSLTGGIVDGIGIAKGISIDGGRESAIREVSIKHTHVGIHIKKGANNNSSDSDICNVNIVGTGADSVGVLLEGYDNTLTNMRIADVHIGVKLCSSGNILRNIHPLYTSVAGYTDYQNSCGFYDLNGNNWYNVCYSDQFGIGFRTAEGVSSVYDSCFCMWYSTQGGRHVGFRADGRFDSTVTNYKIGFLEGNDNAILELGEDGGCGIFQRVLAWKDVITDSAHEPYLRDGIY